MKRLRRGFKQLRGIVVIVWPLLAAVACLLGLAYVSMSVISSTRAYVNGESLWSKGHKDAVFHLLQYARTKDEADYARFEESISAPLGDQQARLTLDGPEPDLVLAKAGFLQGGVHPADVDDVIVVFQRFRHISFFAAAVDAWTKGDEYISKLRAVGQEMHQFISSGRSDPATLVSLEERVRVINRELTPLTTEFSRVLGDAARATRSLLWAVMLVATGLLVPLGLFLVSRILTRAEKLKDAQEKLQKEVEIASQIQVSILPTVFRVPGLDIAAAMNPADSVGGDCYDVQPTADGCWISIGDVAGHGLTSGLVALMTQSALGGITQAQPDASPKDVLRALNATLYENVHQRMKASEHVTFVLLRYFSDGRVLFAGAHEELLVWRARTGQCEWVPTPGTWLGAMSDIGPHLTVGTLLLEPADVLVLYTDGVVEARDAAHEEFGMARMAKVVEGLARNAKPAELVGQLLKESMAWARVQDDDASALVIRRVG